MMEQFEAVLFAGHKEDAVEVPFDPSRLWNLPKQKHWNGRNGNFVQGTINGIHFESALVPRMKKFFLLIDEDIKAAAKIAVGDIIKVVIEPLATPAKLI
mgnify:CR=1 FL=1